MSLEELEGLENTREIHIVHKPQRRLDLRWIIISVIVIALLIYGIHKGRIDIRSLKVILGGLLGAGIGLAVGYLRAPRPDYFVEIDVTPLRNVIDVRLVPKHLRPPRSPAVPVGTIGGSQAYIITSEELAALGLAELNVRRDTIRSLARRVVSLEKMISERLADIEIESLRKARQLFERYLRLRRKLAEEAVERPRKEVSEE